MRPIDPAAFGEVSPPADLGAVPMLQWLKISDLIVDDSYQREIRGTGRKNVETIARDFCWLKFLPVVVSPVPGGKFAIIDGQHRTTAAALIGINDVPCQVVIADRAAQASAFAAINGSTTRVSRQQVFFAAAAAGDATARAVIECCQIAGVTLLRYAKAGSDMSPGQTIATSALETVYRSHGRETLITALQCVTETSNNLAGILSSGVIRAIGAVLGDHTEWRDAGEGLLRAFDSFDLAEHLENARERSVKLRGVTATVLLEAAITEHLDKTLGAGP